MNRFYLYKVLITYSFCPSEEQQSSITGKKEITNINFFLVGVDFCHLLMETVWTQIRTDRTSVLLGFHSGWHSDSLKKVSRCQHNQAIITNKQIYSY